MRLSLSTWSLHGILSSGIPLLDVPALIAGHGIGTVEICHFHFPTTDRHYLAELRSAFHEASIETFSILIDEGDIVSPDPARRAGDLSEMRRWIEIAGAFGATGVRVDAGLQAPTPEVIRMSAANLSDLAIYGNANGVQVFTENWHETSVEPHALLEILNHCTESVGLCVDTGNAEGPNKYATLELLLPKGTSMHFKARYHPSGEVDLDDAETIVQLMNAAAFSGPVSLIYGETENEWNHIDQLKQSLTRIASVPSGSA